MTTDPIQLDAVLAETFDGLRVPCVVRDYEVKGGRVSPLSPPCELPAVFESLCRVCGHGGPTCAPHELQISTDPATMCASCGTLGAGALLYMFVPLGQ
jgi:hypothetical protein